MKQEVQGVVTDREGGKKRQVVKAETMERRKDMEIGKLNKIFDTNCELTDQMSKVVEKENEEGREMRTVVDDFIQGYVKLDPAGAIKLESAINGLVVLTGSAYLALGFVLGQSFSINDRGALAEVDELNRKIKEEGFLPFWTKNNNGCHPSAKIETAAIR